MSIVKLHLVVSSMYMFVINQAWTLKTNIKQMFMLRMDRREKALSVFWLKNISAELLCSFCFFKLLLFLSSFLFFCHNRDSLSFALSLLPLVVLLSLPLIQFSLSSFFELQ